MTNRLDSLVRERYASAVNSGALLFTESTVFSQSEQGVDFEVRYVPILAKKPSSKPKEKLTDSSFTNPFLPFDTRLHVASIGSTHQLLLNKYCIVPNHLLITTAEFRQQGETLTAADFGAVLDTTGNLSSPQIVFYNSGEESGASQPHKHLQVLPMPTAMNTPPTVRIWLQSMPKPGQVCSSSDLPFANFGIRFDPGAAAPSPKALEAAYSHTLQRLIEVHGDGTSYNMVLTPGELLLFPRRQSTGQGISINSLGMAGMVLCKSSDEMVLVKEIGILELLSRVGCPTEQAKSAT
ncbi:bifunctional AP-4-A phosphorylase/ADP sulfurylase [Coemansia thaxteri]|uniref:Bifunctional AP-4-A phosphorylase/ADP sulfurylase n=1 Tax=Coemansia thaxteri TaxID=2663907 RepID=A0A9W8EGM8_9FUNG|nr:bifunctional AP-4-A phosphorylase/ADP sulfurylase [Coemansia thaxteri]KAJ2485786.1 bifunctional AP-4-A phosphorylase/ADP sulfurylase [Coemansia sp. RSA 2320]